MVDRDAHQAPLARRGHRDVLDQQTQVGKRLLGQVVDPATVVLAAQLRPAFPALLECWRAETSPRRPCRTTLSARDVRCMSRYGGRRAPDGRRRPPCHDLAHARGGGCADVAGATLVAPRAARGGRAGRRRRADRVPGAARGRRAAGTAAAHPAADPRRGRPAAGPGRHPRPAGRGGRPGRRADGDARTARGRPRPPGRGAGAGPALRPGAAGLVGGEPATAVTGSDPHVDLVRVAGAPAEAHPGGARAAGGARRPARRAHRPGRRHPAAPAADGRADRAARRGGHPPRRVGALARLQRRSARRGPRAAGGGPLGDLRLRGGGGPVGRRRARAGAGGAGDAAPPRGAAAGPGRGRRRRSPARLPPAVRGHHPRVRRQAGPRRCSPTSCSRSAAPTGPLPETGRGWSGWCAGRPSCRPRPGPGARHRRRSPGSRRREHTAGDGRGRRTGVVRGAAARAARGGLPDRRRVAGPAARAGARVAAALGPDPGRPGPARRLRARAAGAPQQRRGRRAQGRLAAPRGAARAPGPAAVGRPRRGAPARGRPGDLDDAAGAARRRPRPARRPDRRRLRHDRRPAAAGWTAPRRPS